MMDNDIERVRAAALNQILSDWHQWQIGYSHGKGFPGTAAGMEQYRVSRQYDFDNGAMDAELHGSTMKAIDFQVSEMVDPFRTAIYLNARNIAVKCNVFRSPRLPQDEIACLKIIAEARDILIGRLEKAGVM